MTCDCDECRFFKQQIVLAERFNRWMAYGFTLTGMVFVVFILGVLFGWW